MGPNQLVHRTARRSLGTLATCIVLGCNALLGTPDPERLVPDAGTGGDTSTSIDETSAAEAANGANGANGTTTTKGDSGPSTDGATSADDASTGGGTIDGPTGPGPHGSLPSGYCCNSDAECRFRHCAAAGDGTKMCLDQCRGDSICRRNDLDFACSAQQPYEPGWCQPTDPSFSCVPQERFQRGTREVGACCTDGIGGDIGSECEGYHCNAYGRDGKLGPFVCSHWCERGADCPAGTRCFANWCAPGNFPYTCD